jgi:TatD DNase family protein
MTTLIDFHCHLDLYPDFEAAVGACETSKIFTLAVTTTPAAWSRNRAATRKTRYVRAALGLHPQLVSERPSDPDLWEELLPQARYVGEVGLDAGPRFYGSWAQQQAVFDRVLKCCAAAGGKVLSVHSVRAARAVLDAVEARLPSRKGRVVLHWFTGSGSDARRAADLGCYFSINAEMLAKDKHAEMVRSLPRDRLLTETDGPFTEVDGRPAEPRDVSLCVSKLAHTLRMAPDELTPILLANLKSLVAS